MKRIIAGLLALLLMPNLGLLAQTPDIEWETLNGEAMLLYRQGSYDRAIAATKKALQIAERNGLDHPNVATSLNNLAALYKAKGQYADAEPLYQRSLAIREKALGPHHPIVAQSLKTISQRYTIPRVDTPRRNRSTSVRWKSGSSPLARIIPMWRKA